MKFTAHLILFAAAVATVNACEPGTYLCAYDARYIVSCKGDGSGFITNNDCGKNGCCKTINGSPYCGC